jgi:hypothetical protein
MNIIGSHERRRRGRAPVSRSLAALPTAVLLAGSLALATGGSALAFGTLDQHQDVELQNTITSGSASALAQTFTAGVSGVLDTVSFRGCVNSAFAGDMTVEIRDSSGGQPGTTTLASGYLSQAGCPGPEMAYVSLDPAPTVVAGDVYALVLGKATSDEIGVTFDYSNVDPYSRGAYYQYLDGLGWVLQTNLAAFEDLRFATYVGGSAYSFGGTGFAAPIDPDNVVKAGQKIALKWNLYSGAATAANEVIDPTIGAGHYSLSSAPISCGDVPPSADTVPVADDAGNSGLHYDYYATPTATANGQNAFVWSTLKSWAGGCRRFTVAYSGVATLSADFKFTK